MINTKDKLILLEGRKLNKLLRIFPIVILLSSLVFGCGSKDYNAMQEKHAAVKTYREGKWKVRYNSLGQEYTDSIKSTTLFLSVDVLEELTEEKMRDIMDYYEFTKNAQWDGNNHYIGERETDYVCYAVFFRGETDEEIRRIKYCNREEVEISEEEMSYFPKPHMYSSEEEIGEDGINGPLP